MQAFGQTFEITVNTIFHYLPFTRARWRRRTALAKIRGKKRLADGRERWGEGLSAQHVEGWERASGPQKLWIIKFHHYQRVKGLDIQRDTKNFGSSS